MGSQSTYVDRRRRSSRSNQSLACGRTALGQEDVHQPDHGARDGRRRGASEAVPQVRLRGRPQEVERFTAVLDNLGRLHTNISPIGREERGGRGYSLYIGIWRRARRHDNLSRFTHTIQACEQDASRSWMQNCCAWCVRSMVSKQKSNMGRTCSSPTARPSKACSSSDTSWKKSSRSAVAVGTWPATINRI